MTEKKKKKRMKTKIFFNYSNWKSVNYLDLYTTVPKEIYLVTTYLVTR